MKIKKRFLFFMLLILGNLLYATTSGSGGGNSSAEDQAASRLQQILNVQQRPNTGTTAYNEITQSYRNACASCSLTNLVNKFENIQQTLDTQINNNFNGNNQIPYNSRNPFNSGEGNGTNLNYVQYEDGTIGDLYVAKDGTTHLGLVKYMYDIAGVNTSGFNEQDIEGFAKNTSNIIDANTILKTGDLVIMNYDNDHSIDSIGLVYKDNNGQMMMLEMGANALANDGSSVKSPIPISGNTGTSYLVPFETVMKLAYSNPENDPDFADEIRQNVTTPGKVLTVPDNSARLTTLATPRPNGVLFNNGYTENTITTGTDGKEFLESISGATRQMFSVLNRGQVKFSHLLLGLMVLGMILDISWTVLKNGFTGDVVEIYQLVFSKVLSRMPYFIFVILYPIIMRDIVMPIFLNRLPTYFFGEFVRNGDFSLENGKYIGYMDVVNHIFKKGKNLMLKSFSSGILAQPNSISGIWNYFAKIWQTLDPTNFTDALSVATAIFNGLGMLTKIINTIMQVFLYRPITAVTGILIVICMCNIAMSLFLCTIMFMLSTSVAMFYFVCGTMDILQSKAQNIITIIISGILQYCCTLAFIIVFAEALYVIGNRMPSAIFTASNLMNMLPAHICVAIVAAMATQIGKNIASNF